MSLERLGFLVVRDRLARTGKEAHILFVIIVKTVEVRY